jgi:arsenite methyltransferase
MIVYMCVDMHASRSCVLQSAAASSEEKENDMEERTADQARTAVRERYGELARTSGSCCGPDACGPSSCGPSSQTLGYTAEELASVPAGADLSLGCGNPRAIALLQPGEVVLDLGSGPGLDCFLAGRQVGPTGHVIGVDMTPDMLARARDNARAVEAHNVEFRLGEIEHLPVADSTVDVVISNCVIKLSPDKPAVFREAWRVLKPGGRLALADVVATAELPADVRADLAAYTACIAGAASLEAVQRMLTEAGFVDIRVRPLDESREILRQWQVGAQLEDYVLSASIEARRP